MFNLKSIALKLFRAASTHILTSISIIAIAVCLIMTMGMYIWNAKAQIEEEIYNLFGEAEMSVGYNPDQEKWITSEQLAAIEEIEGINAVSPVLIANTLVEGKLNSVYTVGATNDELVKSRYHFSSNLIENEVVISPKIAKLFNKHLGDEIKVENKEYKIKEILPAIPGTSENKMIIMASHAVQQILAIKPSEIGMYTLIDIEKKALTQNITQDLNEIDDELRIDIVNEYDFVKLNFQALSIFMIVLSFFVLMITIVLLTSTFQLVFYKMKEQLMILRAIGASNKQVGKLVQIQLFTIVGVGIFFGVVLSFAVIKSWLPSIIKIMQLPTARTEFPIGLALAITMSIFLILLLSCKWQVRKSMKLLPLQIAKENHEATMLITKKKLYLSGSAFFCAALCLLVGVVNNAPLLVLVGSLLMAGCILFLIPFVFSLLLNISLQPVKMLFGKEVYLACQQLMPHVRRNMPVVLSIVGLMVILIFGTTLLKSTQENEKAYIGYLYESPVSIKNDLWDPSFTNEVVSEVESLPTVNSAYTRSNSSIVELYLKGEWQYKNFEAVDMQQFVKQEVIPTISKNVENGMIITSEFADLHGLKVGDEIRLGEWNSNDQQADEELTPSEVLAIIEPRFMGSEIYFDWSSEVVKQTPDMIVTELMVDTDHIEQTLTELSFLHKQWPSLTFSDYDTYTEESNQMYYQRWSLFVGVLAILIAATCIGVIQTLLHTIYGKRMDYAVQRLLGLTPNGLIKLILSQVLSFVFYGLAVGIIIGTSLTKLLALVDTGGDLIFDYKILFGVSGLLIVAILITFSIQSFWISRRTLSDELVE